MRAEKQSCKLASKNLNYEIPCAKGLVCPDDTEICEKVNSRKLGASCSEQDAFTVCAKGAFCAT